jgi:HK97 gp10 family phage protein
MNDVVTMKVHGLEEINRALGELPAKIANKVLRKGVTAGAMLLRGAIRKAAPKRNEASQKKMSKGGTRGPGFLSKNIGARYRRKVSRFGDIHYGVGPTGQGFYGYFVEAGHAAGKRKKYGRGITASTGLKMVPPHPFILPTFNSMTQQVIDKTKEKLSEGIVKESRDSGFQAH